MARAMQRAPFFARGTEEALEYGLKEAAGRSQSPRQLHDYKPHRKFLFCDVCGYDRDEPLMHNP